MDILSRIHHALQIHQGQLVFPYFDFVPDLSNCVHRTNIYIDLSTEVTQLFAYCVCRFLIFKWQHVSDWSCKYSLLRCLRVCESSDTFDSMNGRMVDCTRIL